MTSLILISLAAIFEAIMDTLAHHFTGSVFKNLNPKFWNPNESWVRKHELGGLYKSILSPFTDAWHLAKLIMLSFIVGTVVAYEPMFNWYIDFAIYWTARFIVFEGFYCYILRR
jgi:hypothetical protein